MPRVGKKDLLEAQTAGLPLSWVQSAAAWLEWVVGFIGGATPQRRRMFLVSNHL
jgi:hypothetical protein